MRRRYIEIGGVRYAWADLLKLRREQQTAARQPQQEPLFEVREDSRPATQKSASGRFAEPTLFDD
jgi:hypothetical protein